MPVHAVAALLLQVDEVVASIAFQQQVKPSEVFERQLASVHGESVVTFWQRPPPPPLIGLDGSHSAPNPPSIRSQLHLMLCQLTKTLAPSGERPVHTNNKNDHGLRLPKLTMTGIPPTSRKARESGF
jgi:hypothetical protein